MDIIFDFKDSLISTKIYNKFKIRLEKETLKLKQATKIQYEDERCTINLPFDKTILKKSKKLLKKIKRPKIIIIVGIGGSNLGTIAVYEALKGKCANEFEDKKIYYADTTDANSINKINNIIKSKLKKQEKVLINAISKSGGTAETLANFAVLKQTLKKLDKEYKNHIVITTVKNSSFYLNAKKEGFHTLTIHKNVGGRYSVFSAVGIFHSFF